MAAQVTACPLRLGHTGWNVWDTRRAGRDYLEMTLATHLVLLLGGRVRASRFYTLQGFQMIKIIFKPSSAFEP